MRLETERLVLRPFEESELDRVRGWLADPETARYQPPLYGEREREEAARLRLDAEHCLAVCLAETGEPVGELQLERGSFGVCEIACTIDRRVWGAGYAFEAVGALMTHLFTVEGMQRITALTDTRNRRACRVLERLGLAREGVMRRHSYTLGEDGERLYRDAAMYAALSDEWLSRTAPVGDGAEQLPGGVTLRTMTAADYDAVRELWENAPGVGLRPKDDSREAVGRYLARNPRASVVAECGGRTVGALLAGHDGRRGYIYHAAVSGDMRRRGIARAMVDRAVAALRADGIDRCALTAFTGNEGGRAFWESCGWLCRGDVAYYNLIGICGDR